jgi:hypothetical protein
MTCPACNGHGYWTSRFVLATVPAYRKDRRQLVQVRECRRVWRCRQCDKEWITIGGKPAPVPVSPRFR